MNADALRQLAGLVAKRNAVCSEIARVIGRPAFDSHIAEFIASEVFGIELQVSASNKGFDGRFCQGNLTGRTVNIKWRGKNDGTLNLSPAVPPPDFYLVLAGATSAPGSSRGKDRPWLIEAVYLFDAPVLVGAIRDRGTKVGTACSVASEFWHQAEVFPKNRNKDLRLDDVSRAALSWFALGKLGV